MLCCHYASIYTYAGYQNRIRKMGTLTIRGVPEEVIKEVKTSAELHQHSMEQEIRELLQQRYGPRSEVLRKIRERWEQIPRTDAKEIEHWREKGRR